MIWQVQIWNKKEGSPGWLTCDVTLNMPHFHIIHHVFYKDTVIYCNIPVAPNLQWYAWQNSNHSVLDTGNLFTLDLDRKLLFLENYYTIIGCHGDQNAKH